MIGQRLGAQEYIQRLNSEIARCSPGDLTQLADLVYDAWEAGKQVFVFGNGGHGTTASHISEDLGKNLILPSDMLNETTRRLRVMSLSDNTGWITALGNDLAFDQIFVQQLMNFGTPGDLVIGISGSGNSANIINALEWGNRHELATFAFTGFDGGGVMAAARYGLHVPLHDMEMVESIHLALAHWVVDDVRARVNHLDRYALARVAKQA
jgi:D-sedoheptulose 7-phosphate isomerase